MTIGPVHLLNADLHSHSTVSDGTLSPEDLAARAARCGVQLWALTDHDHVGGLARAREAALDHGLGWLAGTEVSVTFAGETVHVLGLGFDWRDEALAAGLAATRSGRLERARAIDASLARAGIPGTLDGAMAYVDEPETVSRTHFARHLVDRGICSDMGDVFRRFLKEGKPGDVPHRWARLGDAVRWITAAGGMAVVAHPARCRFSPTVEYALFSEFAAHGGRGVEVLVPAHTEAERLHFAGIAQEFGLYASRGSDFHDPVDSRTDLGALPDLPGHLRPVWEALAPRIEGQEWM
ncbi:MAG: PHP domain-containing protein [Rubrivivax sp.]|nr:PHP domain-containing protein [Rubrivivax sp.]